MLGNHCTTTLHLSLCSFEISLCLFHCVAQAGLILTGNHPASALGVLELKARATTTQLYFLFFWDRVLLRLRLPGAHCVALLPGCWDYRKAPSWLFVKLSVDGRVHKEIQTQRYRCTCVMLKLSEEQKLICREWGWRTERIARWL